MLMEIWIAVGLAIWWAGVCLMFVGMVHENNHKAWETVAYPVLWPVVAITLIPLILWRIKVRTAKQILADLRDRKLLREFEEWLKSRDKKEGL
jgi:heme exporter protein D